MVREGLQLELRSAISRAKKENTPVSKGNLQIRNGHSEDPHAAETTRWVSFEVIPITLSNLKEVHMMIVFQDAPPKPSGKASARGGGPNREEQVASGRLAKLEQELAATKEYLQSVIETQEAMNEELQSANEEILSSNEELQSTNEELGTANEELQSANEELTTVNDELRSRNLEITQVNNDLTNLLSSTDIAAIMVGSDLTVRRFTPKAQKFFGLIPGDVGRPLRNISPIIEIAGLHSIVAQVMADFLTVEKELTDKSGVHYQMKVLPYRTLDNKIDGAVITIVDIAPDKPSGEG
jgi:two-component system CheB/CheR fusion protein